jgi:hypothetical protein
VTEAKAGVSFWEGALVFCRGVVMNRGSAATEVKFLLLVRIQCPAVVFWVSRIRFMLVVSASRERTSTTRVGGDSSGDFLGLGRFLPGAFVIGIVTKLCQEKNGIVHERLISEYGICEATATLG